MKFPALLLFLFHLEGNALDSALEALGRVERREGRAVRAGIYSMSKKAG